MRDRDVRAALHARLLREHSADLDSTLVVDELGLCGEVRVDVAVVNACLSGFELKSASDTLRRLPRQAQFYSQVLDYCTLVVAENHLDDALTMVPIWWGCVVVRPTKSGVRLEEVAQPRSNEQIDAYSLAQLLWRDEALAALQDFDAVKGCRSKSRKVIWERLAEVADLESLRATVRTSLKARQRWRLATMSARSGRELEASGATCRSSPTSVARL